MTVPELTVVMPVHNEEGAIVPVVTSWARELDRLDVDYRLTVYDDGSADRTRERLAELELSSPRLAVVEQPNAGHGPTVLRGYHEARGEWIFQVDSDGELSPAGIEALWRQRRDYDFLIGDRRRRRAPAARRLMTLAARLTVHWAFGPGRRSAAPGRAPRDVNCPYRLMRRERLAELLPYLEPAAFAPNVALSGLAAAAGLRIYEAPIESRERAAGESSLRRWRLIGAAVRSWLQTVRTAHSFRRTRRRARRAARRG